MIPFIKPSFLAGFAILLLVQVGMPGILCAEKSLSVPQQRLLYRAQQAMDKEEFGKVREILSSYLEEHPDTRPPLFFLTLGNACFQSENLERAAHWYQKGFDKNPDDLTLCRNLAAARYGLEQFIKAGKLFENAYTLASPKEPELLYQAAISYYQAERYKPCKTVLSKLFKVTSERKKSWMQLMIQVSYEQHDLTGAENLLKNYLETYPREKQYWKLLAGIQTEVEHYRSAAVSLLVTTALGTPTPQEWKELASLYLYLNAPLQAAQCLEKTLIPSSGAQEHDALARAYLRAHRYDDAVRHLAAAMRKDPTPIRLMTWAKTLMSARRFEQAIQVLEKNMSTMKDPSEAYLLMAYCSIDMQDWIQAECTLRKIKEQTLPYKTAQNILQNIEQFLDKKQ